MEFENDAPGAPRRSELLVNLLVLAGVLAASIIWWESLKSVVIFVITLGILVAIHEWGHFIASKASGVHVYEFALGFGPKLLTYMRRGGTEYTIRAFPLGGFVNPKGMQPDDPITPDGLNGRRPAERALVYLAGPLMNMILAVTVLCASGWLFGTYDRTTVLVGQVKPKSEATRLRVVSVDGQPVPNHPQGLRVGDRIVAVQGEPVSKSETVTGTIQRSAGKQLELEVERKGRRLTLQGVPPEVKVQKDFLVIASVPAGTKLDVKPGDQLELIDGSFPVVEEGDEMPQQTAERLLREKAGQPVTLLVWRDGKTPLVVEGPAAPLEIEVRPGERTVGQLGFELLPGEGPRIGFVESVQSGLVRISNFFVGLASLFTPRHIGKLGESVGGPIAIFDVLRGIDQLPIMYYFGMLASLSLSLAVFNLLPIPVLDGGHMLVLTWEVIRGRRLEPETHKAVALVGLAIIGVLFLVITFKDIGKYFG
ncbi:MAG: site-2 protease family protein [Armatimonadota bacterium]